MKILSTSDILASLSGYKLTVRMFGNDMQISGTADELKRFIRSGALSSARAVSCNGGTLADIGLSQQPLPCSLAVIGECPETACYGVYLLSGNRKLFLKPTVIGRH
jgi:hypothetical protein